MEDVNVIQGVHVPYLFETKKTPVFLKTSEFVGLMSAREARRGKVLS